MSIKLTAQSGGSVALDAPTQTDSSADLTLTLPVNTGTSGQVIQTNGSGTLSFATPTGDTAPAFHAKLSGTQSAPSNATFTKLQFANEVFDSNNCFDTSNNRFTPNVGGYYIITLGFSYANGNYSEATSILQIRKNGSADNCFGTSSRVGGFESRWGFNVSGVVQLNGSGDYVEGYIYGPSHSIDSGNETFFSGGLVRLT